MSAEEARLRETRVDEAAELLWTLTRQRLSDRDAHHVADATIRRIMTAAIKLYVAKIGAEGRPFRPIEGRYDEIVTPTEALTVASEILRAVGLGAMEFGLWSHRQRDDDPLDDHDPRR